MPPDYWVDISRPSDGRYEQLFPRAYWYVKLGTEVGEFDRATLLALLMSPPDCQRAQAELLTSIKPTLQQSQEVVLEHREEKLSLEIIFVGAWICSNVGRTKLLSAMMLKSSEVRAPMEGSAMIGWWRGPANLPFWWVSP